MKDCMRLRVRKTRLETMIRTIEQRLYLHEKIVHNFSKRPELARVVERSQSIVAFGEDIIWDLRRRTWLWK